MDINEWIYNEILWVEAAQDETKKENNKRAV